MKVDPACDQLRRPGIDSCRDAGDLLLNPVALAALMLLLTNDHFFKAAWPGPLTGKLSDLAGVIFLPLFLVSAWEVLLALIGRWRAPSMRAVAVSTVVSTTTFGLVKALPGVADLAGQILGVAQWVIALPIVVSSARPLPPVVGTRVIADPTDLVVLPAVAVALWLGMRRAQTAQSWAEMRPEPRTVL